MEKISINMLSIADKVDGQGVGSAYNELINLLNEGASDIFDIKINSKEKCDIIHCHTINPGAYFRMMRNKKVIKVTYVHFLADTLKGSLKIPRIIFPLFRKYLISFYNKANHIIVVNPIFIQDLVNYGIKEEKITYIPNYVSKDTFYKKTSKEIMAIRKKYDIKNNDFVVLGAGQVQTRKGVLDFVEVAKKCPDKLFVWCGGFSFGKITEGYEELKKVMDNPPQNVKFLGIIPRSEMNDMFNMSDLLFMPSYNELFPMTILEAVNLEKPLLLRDLALYEDILFKKYIKAPNNEEFAGMIEKLSKDKKFYESCSGDSKYISEYYSKENVLRIWIDFYKSIYKK